MNRAEIAKSTLICILSLTDTEKLHSVIDERMPLTAEYIAVLSKVVARTTLFKRVRIAAKCEPKYLRE